MIGQLHLTSFLASWIVMQLHCGQSSGHLYVHTHLTQPEVHRKDLYI